MSPRKRKSTHAEIIRSLFPVFRRVLSPRQSLCLELHYFGGKSLSEIGREQGISRQAVLDAVVHGEQRLLELGQCLQEAGISLPQYLGSPPPEQSFKDLLERLRALREQIAREGIIYSPRWIVDELEAIEASLRRPLSP